MSRPVIGRLFVPAWFELRRSDGTYSAKNAPMGAHEHRLQRCLLDAAPQSMTGAAVAYGCIVVAVAVVGLLAKAGVL